MITMQQALLGLTEYWAARGCVVLQPMNTEVGAGTLNPATFLRVLGPEPWRAAYVEPSVRPDDARYGENPNRLQTHTQFQVVLKPEPACAQELYLGSLQALGIDVRAHDVRFVEDNWASPALGAWGLGWEVWLDGLEITQFTYFQQAGGVTLDPVSVEITYGMERILMALQRVGHFRDIGFAPGVTYGEIFGQAEYEMSRYYLDEADVSTTRALLERAEREAERMLDLRLPIPAHSYVLKCSHAFNVLDSRAAVSTTDRARAFGRMRRLSARVARLWIERRAELAYPLGLTARPEPGAAPVVAGTAGPEGPATLVFEIGVEELPAAEVTRGAEALRAALLSRLSSARLEHGEAAVFGTPRRLVAVVADVAARQTDRNVHVRGPRVRAASGPDGEPTRAAIGFARAQGVGVDQLERMAVGGVEYVAVLRREESRAALDVLAELLPEVVRGLPAENAMRWCDPDLSYSRPVRWVLALLGDAVPPFAIGTLTSGRVTRTDRTAEQQEIEIARAEDYLRVLTEKGLLVDPLRRRDLLVATAGELAAAAGGEIRFDEESALVEEIVNLVERPTPIIGGFDCRFLELPDEILATVMRKHQRYLPVRDASGRLLAHFVTAANGSCDPEVVRAGNEAVLAARFEDALFFWRADLSEKPSAFRARLTALAFEERLGSMSDRADRIAALGRDLGEAVGSDAAELETLDRAGALAKFDLATRLVVELPNLAGVMAKIYAERAGEPAEVAQALFEMDLPRQGGDRIPTSRAGALLSMADRLDLLAGLFGVGATPTGSSDPFALRRAASGLISVLRAHPALAAIGVRRGLDLAAARQPVEIAPRVRDEAAAFVIRRYEQQLLDAGRAHASVRAVLPLADVPAAADVTLDELDVLGDRVDFKALAAALQRIRRILPAEAPGSYEPDLLHEPAEQALHRGLSGVRRGKDGGPGSLSEYVATMSPLVDGIDRFFDEVLVMADDPALRRARMGLLNAIYQPAARLLNWSAL